MMFLLSTVIKGRLLVAAILEIVLVSNICFILFMQSYSIWRAFSPMFQMCLCSVTGATRWQNWSAWSDCYLKDDSIAKCWKDQNDPPKATRTRICIKETSKTEELCNTETRNCATLPICTFGEISIFHSIVVYSIINYYQITVIGWYFDNIR